MEAFLVSTSTVALAEIGDKTQLLSLFLAARFRAPIPIIFGILVATLLNHGLSAWLGVWITEFISPQTGRLLIGISFIAVALWILIPDKEEDASSNLNRYGAFISAIPAGNPRHHCWHDVSQRPNRYFRTSLDAELPLNAARYAASIVFMLLGILTLLL